MPVLDHKRCLDYWFMRGQINAGCRRSATFNLPRVASFSVMLS